MARTEGIIRRFPSFYQSEDAKSIFYQFIAVFGKALDEVESDLIKVMRAHWVNTADNEGSQGFNTTQKGNLDKIFSLDIENLGGTSQLKQVDRRSGPDGEKDDAVYRERIKGLINVLKRGASTKEGIIAIVAANLGIVEGKEGADEARKQIRVIEFLPEPVTTELYQKALFEEFVVGNPNLVDTTPEIRLRIREGFHPPLVNPRIVNLSTGLFAQYRGGMKSGDVLSFFPGGTAFLNGVLVPVEGTTPALPPGESHWRFEAAVGFAAGRFDRSRYDYSTFDQDRQNRIGLFDVEGSYFDEAIFALSDLAVDLDMTFSRLTPASFMVCIPWDIPGFTEQFDELADNPRIQIKYIVDKVKAAGVFAVIAYEKRFEEDQGLKDFLTVQLPLREEHVADEANFDIGSMHVPYPGGVEHDMSEALITSGMFDYTRFDSLNTFA
jgi:hypothetical protein